MRRAKGVSLELETRFWREVEILDEFWRRKFVNFITPLQPIYVDPTSAGVAMLTGYLSDPCATFQLIEKEPESFGHIKRGTQHLGRDLAIRFASSSKGISLEKCAQDFQIARRASKALDGMRAAYPHAFAELQRQRGNKRRKK